MVQDAVQACHQLCGEGEERVAGRIRSTELDALRSRGGAGQRDTDGGGAVTSGVHQVDRSLEARNQTVVGVQRRLVKASTEEECLIRPPMYQRARSDRPP